MNFHLSFHTVIHNFRMMKKKKKRKERRADSPDSFEPQYNEDELEANALNLEEAMQAETLHD